ncbi:DUF1156 domain-containing protein [Hymenobacter wooponensis]|uniref:DUF1156 domain-containing protein n=1 Tax=Hymenobacter wooponensis TaxID=1525360 RepID=A0A4Z0MC93_9BACT|nr:DUF1156 domain-containing protein [Hymenobacter wooponensis]TGD77000.1 DUF1156 domain-containing protein [Hymenobacter wooponensis]
MALRIPRKLIEVALPLDDINTAAAREKSIRHGHPSTLHLWWARRPLAAARAVLFAQMVNDPGGVRGWGAYAGQTKEKAQQEREELFDIIRELVKWENTSNETVLERARQAIRKSWQETCEMNKGVAGFDPELLPAFHDPFAGGGALPLEAQRLGLVSYASDLNPVAVLINKAMIEIPPRFANRLPTGPLPGRASQGKIKEFNAAFPGAYGLAEDVKRYGHWVREEAFSRIGHLYPKVALPTVYGGGTATVIAWLWARTVASPNPALSGTHVPLVSSFWLSKKTTNRAWVEAIIEDSNYHFEVRTGEKGPSMEETVNRKGAYCILSKQPIPFSYIREEGKAGRLKEKLFAIVVEGPRGRYYLSPEQYHVATAESAVPSWKPDFDLPLNPRDFKTPNYGITSFGDLFTPRQLVALNTLVDVVADAREKVISDTVKSGGLDDGVSLEEGGNQATAYADAIAVYLTFAISRTADRCSNVCTWDSSPKMEALRNTYGRQAIPMTWDFAEGNPFSESSGNYLNNIDWIVKALQFVSPNVAGFAKQVDAQQQTISKNKVISTDPPYYDNIGYADLSDFFYIWLRRSLHGVMPKLFSTMAVPKADELVASPYRHGGKEAANSFFINGMTQAIHALAEQAHPAFPVTIYYAFKQSDTTDSGTVSTGWDAFLEAVISAGFSISGTWPMRTEMGNRMIGADSNALASSIILVCQKRDIVADEVSRREFMRELRLALPEALEAMIAGRNGVSPVAPVDLAQSAIGPGIAVFSRFKAVLESDGKPMSVHTALTLINKEVDGYFFTAEGDLDAESRFCLAWFDQYAWSPSSFGDADVLARAKGTSVAGVQLAGGLEALGGKVRLLRPTEYPTSWHPTLDARTSAWEALHHLIRVLRQSGETPTGRLLAAMPALAEPVRQLAYRLYTQCERTGRAEDARAYNELIIAWPSLQEVVQAQPVGASQTSIEF